MKKDDLIGEYGADKDAVRVVHDSFREKESMLISKVEDSITNSSQFRSRVTDSRLSTIVWERAGRVMGQQPTGLVKALSQKDKGKAVILDLILQRYVIPNANSQYSFLTKTRMWDMYSMVYGMMPVISDYRVDDAYIGPDFWLINPRNFIPQQGKTSINDSDHAYVDTGVSVSFLESKLKSEKGGWIPAELRQVIKKAKDGSRTEKKDDRDMSYVEETREHRMGGTGKAAQVKLTTRYEAGADGEWITFCPEYDGCIVRRLKNPHKTGKIPITLKHCFPLIDSIFGLGDFERGKTLQYAMDSLINLYLDGVKMSIFPPLVTNPNGVVPSSIRYSPGARWLETIPNSIRAHQASPQGLTTFNSTYQFLIGSLLNQNGTTDTAVTKDSSMDPGYGKTPQALEMLQQRENTRDNWDRFMMEQALEELYNNFMDMIVTKQEKAIDLHLFDEEIEQVREVYPEIEEMMSVSDSGNTAKVTVSPEFLGGDSANYRYYIDAGSTMKKDEKEQAGNLMNMLIAVSKIPGLQQELAKSGLKYNIGEHIKMIFATSGIDNFNDIVVPATPEEMAQSQAPMDPNGGQPGGEPNLGGETMPPSIAEPQSPEQMAMSQGITQGGEPMQPGTVPAQATGNNFGYMPKSLANNYIDPDVRNVADQLFG